MPVQQVRIVNFGRSRSGLLTVGYSLFDLNGTVVANRTGTGVYELSGSTGIYGASVRFNDGFIGSIVWDTGQASSMVAAEDVYIPTINDTRNILSASILASGHVLSGSTTVNVITDITASTDLFDGYALVVCDLVSGSGARFIDLYSSGTRAFLLDSPLTFVPTSGSTVFVIPELDQNFGGIG